MKKLWRYIHHSNIYFYNYLYIQCTKGIKESNIQSLKKQDKITEGNKNSLLSRMDKSN